MSILVVGSVALDTVETPFTRVEEVTGRRGLVFATAASLYDQVNLVAVVGSDFPQEHLDFLQSRTINLDGLQIQDGPTFRWVGRYHMDMNARDTLDTQLGVYADFHPVLPETYLDSDLLFLANIQPELQMEVLQAAPRARLTVLDTMELWIMTAREQLTEVMKRVDVLLMSEEEVRQYTGQGQHPHRCARSLRAGSAICDRQTGQLWRAPLRDRWHLFQRANVSTGRGQRSHWARAIRLPAVSWAISQPLHHWKTGTIVQMISNARWYTVI